jgi:hypothetical protein
MDVADAKDRTSPTGARRWAPWLVTVAGWLGAVVWLSAFGVPASLPTALRIVLIALGTGALLAGALSLSGDGEENRPLLASARAEIVSGVGRAHHAALPLALLPFARLTSAPTATLVAAALWFAAAFLVMRCIPDETLAPRPRGRRAWYLALLGLSACFGVYYIALASRVRGNFENDSAYYFGVARHIATTWRLEEPVVWHFLSPPATIVHAPFDYWGGLTSLVLVPPMVLFGATHHVAAVTIAMLAAASLAAFVHVLCFQIRLRNPLLEALGLVVFALTPWMAVIRVDTETIVPFQLCLLLALIAYAADRFVWVVVLAFGLVLCRAEGVILGGILSIACVLKAVHGPERGTQIKRILVAASACVGTYVLWSFIAFRSPIPPGIRGALSVQRINDLYAYERVQPIFHTLGGERWPERVKRSIVTIRSVALVPVQDLWLTLAVLPGVGCFRRRPSIESLIWLLFFAGAALLMWTSPRAVFSHARSFSTLVPLAVLVGILGTDAIVTSLGRSARKWRVAQRAVLAVGAFALAWVALPDLRVYEADARSHVLDAELASLDGLLAGGAVATPHPWQLMANTKSPAVSMPENGEKAIEKVLRRYHVRWIVFEPGSNKWMSSSRIVLDQLVAGKRSSIGSVRVSAVKTGTKLHVYRVEDGGADAQ